MSESKRTGVLSYGAGGLSTPFDEALANFPGAATQALSMCCTPVELLSNDGGRHRSESRVRLFLAAS
jgi:hypothetical protein